MAMKKMKMKMKVNSKMVVSALCMLKKQIAEGKEFPDADLAVTREFGLNGAEQRKLVEMYDSEHADGES